ncbi:Rne/Rng family ribonuclease [Oscillatoria sp. FACHB-1406]|uniref:Rne/Rng family ribonuclease n=1 Tax=Oscillatoria sp. FACHB-1406 TaxID=2692846 RepID=UPI0016836EAF|nr:Rne/Rng family ribonuclease [Oscillatoria sp. FACHB-1406]MBD2576784.1 Rne/Rng family ribonuclease [Oscillatoria sp. FACHB-1406]
MPKQIIIAEKNHIAAVFSEDRVQELVVATGNQQVGDIYLGTVENVIPGIDAAFVNIGDAERNGFMHVTDLGPLRLRRSSGAITELLAPQQSVVVQVMKEPTGNKGPRLTGKVSLPGRYLVLMPYGRGVKLSRRIPNDNERSRLEALAILIKPPGMGLLVRTEAEGKDEEAIIEDLKFLQKQWEYIQTQANTTKPPSLLNRDDDFIQRVLRDIYSAEVNRIVVDSNHAVKRVKQQLMNWSGGRMPEGLLIDHHRERQHILEYFRVNAAIREALKPRVDLPSGGYIIIEPTEALTVIDVNSGSFTRSATSRETVLWTNNEATKEIARQLRLRNIGGVIIIDFIDMDARRDQLELIDNFKKALKADKARPQIAQLSELGLVELTRKRQGKNIYELFGQTCPTCGGLGHLVHLPGEREEEVLDAEIPTPPSTVLKLADKREPEPEDEFEFSSEESGSDLDLLHHPNYQEQGANGRRRRRRRINGTEGNGKSKRVFTFGNELKELEEENEPEVRESFPERKPFNRNPRNDNPPTETIAIEMTTLEQDVYALMGISPLVRIDRDVKEAKSVAISIGEPGQTPTVELKAEEPVPEVESAVELESESSEVESDLESNEEAEFEGSEEGKEEGDSRSPLIRRRRRRSSARDGE